MYYNNSYTCYFCKKNCRYNGGYGISPYEICKQCVIDNKLEVKYYLCRKYRLTTSMHSKLIVRTYKNYYTDYYEENEFHEAVGKLLTAKRRGMKKYANVVDFYEKHNVSYNEYQKKVNKKKIFENKIIEYINFLFIKYLPDKTPTECNTLFKNIMTIYKINHELSIMDNVLYLCELSKECKNYTYTQIYRKYELDYHLKLLKINKSINETAYYNYIMSSTTTLNQCLALFRKNIPTNNNQRQPQNEEIVLRRVAPPRQIINVPPEKPNNIKHQQLITALEELQINININDIVNTNQYKLYLNNNLSLDQIINEYL